MGRLSLLRRLRRGASISLEGEAFSATSGRRVRLGLLNIPSALTSPPKEQASKARTFGRDSQHPNHTPHSRQLCQRTAVRCLPCFDTCWYISFLLPLNFQIISKFFAVMKILYHADLCSHSGFLPLRIDSWNPSPVIQVLGFSWPHSEGSQLGFTRDSVESQLWPASQNLQSLVQMHTQDHSEDGWTVAHPEQGRVSGSVRS